MNQDTCEKGITKAEIVELFTTSKQETARLFTVSKAEMVELFATAKTETVDLIDKVISVLDERIDGLKVELKAEIGDLRNDMHERFLAIDRRLLGIETNMVYQHQFKPVVKRVEKLELTLV